MNLWQAGLIKKIVKSPINPILFVCTVIGLPLFVMAALTEGYKFVIFLIIAIALVIAFLIAYFYLLFNNPEYLRSERYQLQMNKIRFYGDKDNPRSIEIGNFNSLVKNPKQNLLPEEKTK